MDKKRIMILGGGFGGVYTAMYLESLLKKNPEYEIIIISRQNYFVYQPMLAEVVGGSVGILDTVSSLRRLIPKATLYIREIETIDIPNKKTTLCPQFSHKPLTLDYEHLVIGLGNVTDFRGAPGLHEHALPFKDLSDAVRIRNHLIDTIEEAAIVQDDNLRKMLLTYVVGGGGFSGTEVVAELNDLVHRLAKKYSSINRDDIKVILVHSKDRLMDRELSESLSHYAGDILKKRGVDIRFGLRLTSASPQGAILSDGQKIPSKTVISTVPSSPNPIIESLPLPQEKGRIKTDAGMLVEGQQNIWAIGDCASIPDITKENAVCPPTAQYAVRQAKVLAYNIYASIVNKPKKNFQFKSLGMLGALGHNSAVAEFFGVVKVSGLTAWFMWRMIYWMKLPGFDRKLKVAFSWFLDMIIPIEAVQLKLAPSQGIASVHFETDDIVFHEGDIGDYLYIIVKGNVDIFQEKGGKEEVLANLGKGEFFGEMSLLNERTRTATVRCKEPTDVLAIRKSDFGVLIANFAELKQKVETTEVERKKKIVNE